MLNDHNAAHAFNSSKNDEASKHLQFIPNVGQKDSIIKYYAYGSGYSVYFTATDLRLTLFKRDSAHRSNPDTSLYGAVIFMEFVDPNPNVQFEGLAKNNHVYNFFKGMDRSHWATGVSGYSEIMYAEVWNGIDLLFEGQKGKIKYNFMVQAGSDPNKIKIRYKGMDQLKLDDADGSLLLETPIGPLRDEKPICYQYIDGHTIPVSAHYVLQDSDTSDAIVSFAIGPEYNPRFNLVIDPGLDYSTYLGGTDIDQGISIWVDNDGYAFVTGKTYSHDFPTTPGAIQTDFGNAYDAFVSKISPDGSEIVWSTFLGGGGNDWGNGIIVDEDGNVYVAGTTGSVDPTPFPLTVGAYQTVRSGVRDAFITKLSPDGDNLIYSTLLGGDDDDYAYAIHVDSTGHAYVTGETTSGDFPVTLGNPFGGISDAFITKFSQDGTALIYSRYLGGNNTEYGRGIRVDLDGYCYVTGCTASDNFPTTSGAFMENHQGDHDIYVSKLNPNGTLNWSTYLGGSADDHSGGICMDSSLNVYVTGNTLSPDYPTTAEAFRPDPLGDQDMIVTKLNPTGSALIYSTRMGGSNSDTAYAIRIDSYGNAYVVGSTNSEDMPTTPDAYSQTKPSNTSALVFKLNSTGSSLIYSTYLGGELIDEGLGIAIDPQGNAYITGETYSEDFPITPGSAQTEFRGLDTFSDAFVLKLDLAPPPPGGTYRLTRFVINATDDFPNDAQQYDGDFFLQYDYRKVIHGIVRDPQGTPMPSAVVCFFKVLSGDPETTCDLESVGHAVTDDCGQFMVGPFLSDVDVVIKIFFLKNASAIGTPSPIIGTATPLDV